MNVLAYKNHLTAPKVFFLLLSIYLSTAKFFPSSANDIQSAMRRRRRIDCGTKKESENNDKKKEKEIMRMAPAETRLPTW